MEARVDSFKYFCWSIDFCFIFLTMIFWIKYHYFIKTALHQIWNNTAFYPQIPPSSIPFNMYHFLKVWYLQVSLANNFAAQKALNVIFKMRIERKKPLCSKQDLHNKTTISFYFIYFLCVKTRQIHFVREPSLWFADHWSASYSRLLEFMLRYGSSSKWGHIELFLVCIT